MGFFLKTIDFIKSNVSRLRAHFTAGGISGTTRG